MYLEDNKNGGMPTVTQLSKFSEEHTDKGLTKVKPRYARDVLTLNKYQSDATRRARAHDLDRARESRRKREAKALESQRQREVEIENLKKIQQAALRKLALREFHATPAGQAAKREAERKAEVHRKWAENELQKNAAARAKAEAKNERN